MISVLNFNFLMDFSQLSFQLLRKKIFQQKAASTGGETNSERVNQKVKELPSLNYNYFQSNKFRKLNPPTQISQHFMKLSKWIIIFPSVFFHQKSENISNILKTSSRLFIFSAFGIFHIFYDKKYADKTWKKFLT